MGYMLGSGCSSCCSGPCPLGSCTITVNFFDENSCEDDAFDFYLENPTTGATRFIQNVDLKSTPSGKCGDPTASYANINVSVTITDTDFDENCEVFFVLTKTSSNCCSTYTRFRITKPDGSTLLGTYFGPAGLRYKYTYEQICEPSPPPPPPGACCKFTVPCNDSGGSPVTVGACTAVEPECCIDSGYTQQQCGTANPPGVTLCASSGAETRDSAPYDCIVGPDLSTLQFSIQNIQVPEISSSLGSRPAAWYASLRSAVEGQLNGTYIFSSVCVSEVYESFPNIVFNWTEPVIPPSSTGNTYAVTITLTATVDVCRKSASLVIGVSGPVSVGFTRTKSVVTPTYYSSRCPVNGVSTLCNCSNYSGSFDIPSGTGSIDVRKAP